MSPKVKIFAKFCPFEICPSLPSCFHEMYTVSCGSLLTFNADLSEILSKPPFLPNLLFSGSLDLGVWKAGIKDRAKLCPLNVHLSNIDQNVYRAKSLAKKLKSTRNAVFPSKTCLKIFLACGFHS